MDLKSTYNKIAEDWFKDHREDTWWLEGVNKFLSMLPDKAMILDVGCGAGVKSRYLASKGFKITGIDFSDKMIEIAKRESSKIDFEIIDIYELDNYEKTFDAVFAQAVLLHIPKTKVLEIIEKLKRKIKSNGLLYLAVKEAKFGEEIERVEKENDYGYDYERFFSFFTLSEIEEYLKESDLKIIWKKVINSGRTNWIQVIARWS